MIYGAILAAGRGERMGNIGLPKQFLMLGGKPIFLHTLEKFILCNEFNMIFVAVPSEWFDYSKDLLKKYVNNEEKIILIEGGETRNETIMNVINAIENNFGLNDEDILVTHDAVRPFVTLKIIKENIKYAFEYGVCDTVVPAIDTIVISTDGDFVTNIPKRHIIYQGQTPQSFNIKKFKTYYLSLDEKVKKTLTDACKVFVLHNEKVKIVRGDYSNFKITTPFDYKLAQALLGVFEND